MKIVKKVIQKINELDYLNKNKITVLIVINKHKEIFFGTQG